MLKRDKDDGEWKLLPFSHEYYSHNPILIDYDPNAKCPKLEKLTEDQIDNKDDRSLIKRWMAPCCWKETLRRA